MDDKLERFVIHPNLEGKTLDALLPEHPEAHDAIAKTLKVDGASLTYLWLDADKAKSGDKFVISKHIESWNWHVIGGTYLCEFHADANKNSLLFFGFCMAGTAIMSLAASVLLSRQLGLLKTISARLERQAGGDFSSQHIKAPQSSGNELHALAQLSVLTPVCKARLTDHGFESANLAMQIHGGHGYIREHGVEQLARDARINMIYEGTNGIQALDLVGRKVLPDQGKALRMLCAPLSALIESHGTDERAARWLSPLAKGADAFMKSSMQTGIKAFSNPDEVGAASVDFLNALACLLEGYCFAKSAIACLERTDDFGLAKKAIADFYFDKLFSEIFMRLKTMSSGNRSLSSFDNDWF